jgi:hypothetical protein
MIGMRVADEQHLDIRPLEAKLFHACPNEFRRLFEAAVDENVPLRRGDEIRRQVPRADVVQIPRNAMTRIRLCPSGLAKSGNSKLDQEKDWEQLAHARR